MKISSAHAAFDLLGAVVDPLREHQDPAEQRERHRDGEDAGERHQQVAAQRDERLAREVPESCPHRVASPLRRRRRAPGRGRAEPWSSSMTRRRIASTMRWSWVAMTTVVPVRLIRSRMRMMPTVVAGSRFPVGSSARRISGRLTNARAIDTRCCSPPESSFGKSAGLLRQADEVEDLRHLRPDHVAGPPDDLHREGDVLVDGLGRQQLVVLEDACRCCGAAAAPSSATAA